MKKFFEILENIVKYFLVALFLIPAYAIFWIYIQIMKLLGKWEQ